jgi:hypothetical protein
LKNPGQCPKCYTMSIHLHRPRRGHSARPDRRSIRGWRAKAPRVTLPALFANPQRPKPRLRRPGHLSRAIVKCCARPFVQAECRRACDQASSAERFATRDTTALNFPVALRSIWSK